MASPTGLPRAQADGPERDPGDRRDDREEQPQQALPLRVQAGPDEEAGRVRVAGRERVRVAELDERRALGGVGRRVVRVGVGGVRDEGPDLRLQLVALARGDGSEHRPDVAIGQRGHASSPWASRRSEASTRVQSSNRAAACRSPSALIAVELPRPSLLRVPLAHEEPLAFQASEERIQRVRVDAEAEIPELVQQRVAVARRAQQEEAGEDDGSPSQLLLSTREDLVKRHARHNSV